jgi:hypothetical protein
MLRQTLGFLPDLRHIRDGEFASGVALLHCHMGRDSMSIGDH